MGRWEFLLTMDLGEYFEMYFRFRESIEIMGLVYGSCVVNVTYLLNQNITRAFQRNTHLGNTYFTLR